MLVEIVLNECGSVAVDLFHQLVGLPIGLSNGFKTENLFFLGSIDERVKDIWSVAQNISGASADDDGISLRRNFVDDFVQNLDHLVGVEMRVAPRGEGAFVTAAGINSKEAVQEGINPFVATLRGLHINFRDARNFPAEFFIPQFPTEASGKSFSNESAATSVFAFYSDDANGQRCMPSPSEPPSVRRA